MMWCINSFWLSLNFTLLHTTHVVKQRITKVAKKHIPFSSKFLVSFHTAKSPLDTKEEVNFNIIASECFVLMYHQQNALLSSMYVRCFFFFCGHRYITHRYSIEKNTKSRFESFGCCLGEILFFWVIWAQHLWYALNTLSSIWQTKSCSPDWPPKFAATTLQSYDVIWYSLLL